MGFIDDITGIYVAVMHPGVTCAATVGRMVSEELTIGKTRKFLKAIDLPV